jgi:hypothetical protein
MTGIEKNRANPSVVNDGKDGSLPTLGFQKAMRNPSHPDFGMDFTSALGLAMAKEKKAHVLAARDNHWLTDDGDSDTIALAAPRRNLCVRLGHAAQGSHASPRPQTRQHSFDKNKVSAQQKFNIVEYTVAKASELGGLDFRDARLVDIFNGIMQRDNPRRPIRNQATLLAISYTDPVEYFGEDLQTLLESETYSEQVGRAIARLLPDSRLS